MLVRFLLCVCVCMVGGMLGPIDQRLADWSIGRLVGWLNVWLNEYLHCLVCRAGDSLLLEGWVA